VTVIVFGIVLPWLVVAFGCWIAYQLVHQNGRLLLRLESLEQRLAPLVPAPSPPQGLPLGSLAPEFELPDLAGTPTPLSRFRGRGLLLIFFSPRCGFCLQMAPDLAALPTDGAEGRPLPLLVSTGTAEENRKLVEEHGVRCPVLLQEQMEVATRYQAHGTPMGCLIDAEGRIASELAVGSEALLALAEGPAPATAVNGNGRHGHKGNRDLAESKLIRHGLPAGTPAPGFTLPRLNGGELSLAAYRGRPVLLVFSDPHCGPCEELLPQLERQHRAAVGVEVVMVARGDVEANRAKAVAHGLTFPIVLQKQWQISLLYGMFATPIAYLIDAEGVIAADVAVGVEPIRALLARATQRTSGMGDLSRRPKKVTARR
jgi:peroxiredoxin